MAISRARASGIYLTGGTARGAKLFSVPGRDVRPALSRVRTSLFEILRSRLEGARVADLFAGTGSLGFEALSRGAAGAVFFDVDDRCVEVLRKNADKLRFADRVEVIEASAFESADRVQGRVFDVVFVDPPYDFYVERREEMSRLISQWAGRLAADGCIVVEHRPKEGFGEFLPGLKRFDERKYGGTVLGFYALVERKD